MPAYLKAGVYYTTKLEAVRHPDQGYYQRLFSYDLIVKAASIEFYSKNPDAACRKYEEAYSIWHYYYTTNPKWNTEGIDDSQLFEVFWRGANEHEQNQVVKHRLDTLLNIAACNLKSSCYAEVLPPVNEALKIDPSS